MTHCKDSPNKKGHLLRGGPFQTFGLGEAELSMHLYDIKENCKSLSDYDVTNGVTLAPNDHAFLLQKGCA